MREVTGDLVTYHEQGHWIAITTNGSVRHDGAAVMGAGIAQQMAIAQPDLPFALADRIRQHGNTLHMFSRWRLFTFPVKRFWQDKASLTLIADSAVQLMRFLNVATVNGQRIHEVFMVRPGCGNGGLDWRTVKPVLDRIVDNRVTIVELPARIADARKIVR